MNKTSKKSAFTLIELLVVISIIAVLASIAIPAFSSAQVSANQSKSMQQAKGIFIGLKLFASDHNGSFPAKYNEDYVQDASNASPPIDANQAYANLVPNYVPSENPFSIPSSAFCKSLTGGYVTPKNDFSQPSHTNVLPGGTNTFAYVMGLSDTSNANYPIIADGFAGGATDVQAAKYTKDETKPGGVWKAKKALVIRCDGSAKMENVNQTSLIVQRTDTPGNLFQAVSDANNPWLSGCKILNPTAPH